MQVVATTLSVLVMPLDKFSAASLETREWSHDVNTVTENGTDAFSLVTFPLLLSDSE